MEDRTETAETKEAELDISWYPSSIEELHELLTFYRKQTIVFKNERTEYQSTLKSLEMSNAEKHKLEWALHKKSQSNQELTRQLSDTHILLYNEKNANIEKQSEVKSLRAELRELEKNNAHLRELVQSANENVHHLLDDQPTGHKNCGACNQQRHAQRVVRHKAFKETNPQKLTTIYLPTEPVETLEAKLAAKEEELEAFKQQSVQITQYLMSDRNKAQLALDALRKEYDAKFEALQGDLQRMSSEHVFNLKEYLNYRRTTKQEMHDLQTAFFAMKHETRETKAQYSHKVEEAVTTTNKIEKELKKKSHKMINGFRMETLRKHEQLRDVKDELKTMAQSYQLDVQSLKSQLSAAKKKNKRLTQINKCQKMGIQTDVDNLKKRLLKLQKAMNELCLDASADSYENSLQNEIDKVKQKLMDLARSAR